MATREDYAEPERDDDEFKNVNSDDILNEDDEYDELDEEDDGKEDSYESIANRNSRNAWSERSKLDTLFQRMQREGVPLRVHDVILKGNAKTKDSVIEAEMEPLRDISTMQELLEASNVVKFRLQSLNIFDSVKITLDSGPPELPGTANVVVEVVEAANPLSGEIGAYTKGEARSSTVEASVKYKNLFGHGDLWDGSLAYGCDHVGEISAGFYVPSRFRGTFSPVTSRVYLLSQDWIKFSSFKERTLGLSVGLLSTKNHDLSYNLGWRLLTDPSQNASKPIRRQLGHELLSSLKYNFKIDRRNSNLRPTSGYAFSYSCQMGGLMPDSRSLRFFRQEVDVRCAIPLGLGNGALNVGIAGGVVFPWGNGYLEKPTPLPERFFLGGNMSPVCTLGGPMTLWGFRTRGLGPTEDKRQIRSPSSTDDAQPDRDRDRDSLGGDMAVTAFADLSFDFPLQFFRSKGIHGHAFVCAGNADKLTENAYRNLSWKSFSDSFRSCVGAGIVVPTNLFRLELNYCYLLKKFDFDHGKTGFRINFST